MKLYRSLKIAGAYIGVIIGAGFATGEEILQYFTSFGYKGLLAVILATVSFAFLGMIIMNVGSRLKAVSHKAVVYEIGGRYFGFIIDAIIIFTLFGTGVVMIAGAGSTLKQQFGVPVFIGSLIMTTIIALAMMLKVDKVISVIASITPILLASIIFIFIYSIMTMELSFAELKPVAESQDNSFPNWFIAAVNYVSFAISLGIGMSLVTGGAEQNTRIAGIGGMTGGISIGIMIMLVYIALFAKVDIVASFDVPLLKIIEEFSPLFAVLYSILLFGMIFNTGLGMFYGFASRFFAMNTKKAKIASLVILGIAYILSFIGFSTLVEKFYSLVGYLGLLLIMTLIYAPFKLKRKREQSTVFLDHEMKNNNDYASSNR